MKRAMGCVFWVTWLGLTAAWACTVVGGGRQASADGSVIVSHTDCGPDSRIRVVPGGKHAPGDLAPVYWGLQDPSQPLSGPREILGYIPQAAETFSYIQSAYSHLNEHQLAIAESTTSQRAELVAEKGQGEQIMTIELAQIFGVQRCRTAREAVRLGGQLVSEWGFLPSSGDGSESLCIGDPREVWVMEVFGVGPGWQRSGGKPGAIWAAQRLPDDQACMIPNWSIIKEIHPEDGERFLVSANWRQEAIDRGWYAPESGKPFIWQEIYAPIPREWATGRFWLFHSQWAPSGGPWPERKLGDDPFQGLNQYYQYVEPLSIYPFSIRPERKISVRDVIAFQRSVFEGTIYDLTADPNWLVPDGKGGYVKSPLATPFPGKDLRALLRLTNRRPVARHRGHYGMVCQLREWLPDPIGAVYWVYLDNPYISPYIPIYAGVRQTAECYRVYDPGQYSDESARWAIDLVDNLVGLRFQEASQDVQAVRDPFEERMFLRQAALEAEAGQLYAADPEAARDYLTAYTRELMEEVPRMYQLLRDALVVKYTNNRE